MFIQRLSVDFDPVSTNRRLRASIVLSLTNLPSISFFWAIEASVTWIYLPLADPFNFQSRLQQLPSHASQQRHKTFLKVVYCPLYNKEALPKILYSFTLKNLPIFPYYSSSFWLVGISFYLLQKNATIVEVPSFSLPVSFLCCSSARILWFNSGRIWLD